MPAPVEDINSIRSESRSPYVQEDRLVGSNDEESNNLIPNSEIVDGEELLDSRPNIELRKDLLLESSEGYAEMEEGSGLFKNGSLIPEEELEHDYNCDRRLPPSYATLTPCHVPNIIHQDCGLQEPNGDNVNNLTLIPNMLNYNPSCWVPSHEENALCMPPSRQFSPPGHIPMNSVEMPHMEYSQQPYMMMEDPFKPTSMPVIPNHLYHLDTNNRRIWVPESCSMRNNMDRSPNDIGLSSVREADVFLAADFENEELLQQHAVNIERYPNRCWRGSNPSRAQYEKG